MNKKKLVIAFESRKLSYSAFEVDLYNSGVNQILSVAASRNHTIFHFSMNDLYEEYNIPYAFMSKLKLSKDWDGNQLTAYRYLYKADQKPIPLAQVDLFFIRGDDIRHEGTPNIKILKKAEAHSKFIESVEATISTMDKLKTIERTPHIPHPVTFIVHSIEEALDAIKKLPQREKYFIIKDRYGYGCGKQIHRIPFDDPDLKKKISDYLYKYNYILIQEFCQEVAHGDIVTTFWDEELIGSMRRLPAKGEWRTNASLGAEEIGYNLSPEQETIVRTVRRSFPECRFCSVDLLDSGKIIELNAFPGGYGLMKNYNISIGKLIMDRLEEELYVKAASEERAALTWTTERYADRFPSGTQWEDIFQLYSPFEDELEVYDVFNKEEYMESISELIFFDSKSPEFILSIPHSGVFIPKKFKNYFNLDGNHLVEIDLYSEFLYEFPEGMHLISRFAPFFVDMNRSMDGNNEEEKIPGHLLNPPHQYYNVNNKLLLKKSYTSEEKNEVIAFYNLYHRILQSLIERMKRERGYAIIFDCHSMTSIGLGRVYDKKEKRANFVIGTLKGTSAHSQIIESFTEKLIKQIKVHDLNLVLKKDVPFSGGFITRKYNDPNNKVHAIQIEVSMDTYMHDPVIIGDQKIYAFKQPRIRHIRKDLLEAIHSACETAEKIYR